MPQPPATLNTFEALVQILKDLRGPGGCPWDKEQTHLTLTPYAVEEVFEMVEAIESGSDSHMCEELGDVLFQVVLHAQLADERGAFNIRDVITGINEKIVRRHPHVFSGVSVENSAQVMQNWDEIKKAEKKNKKTAAIEVPKGLPALQSAHKIGEKTEKFKFDWANAAQVLQHLKSEIQELEEAMSGGRADEIKHELGDVLFTAAQLSRHLDQEPESDLREANRRFLGRFEKMLSFTSAGAFTDLSAEEKEQLWQRAKKSQE